MQGTQTALARCHGDFMNSDPDPAQKRRYVVRWLAIVPCAVVIGCAMLVFTLALDSFAISVCPADALVSGFCTASWFPQVERGIMVVCAGFAALFVVAATARLAPAYRVRAAWAMFGAAALLAVNMAAQAGTYAEFAATVAGGLLGVLSAWRLPPQVNL